MCLTTTDIQKADNIRCAPKEREQKEIDLSKKILKQDRRKIRCANYIVCI